MDDIEINTAPMQAERRPPAVLQVLPRLVTGGVERGTVDLAAALAAEGWRSLVASEGGPMVDEIERTGAHHVTLPLGVEEPAGDACAIVTRLAALIAREGIDIVHARSRAPAWSAHAAARNAGARFVATFHNAYGAETWLKRRYNSVMAKGERIIAISDFVARYAIDTYGVPADRIAVVHRGVDGTRFDPARTSADRIIRLAVEWGLPDGVPVVMLPGRLTRWKGHSILFEALRRLDRRALHCLIVGGGSARYRRELEAELRRRPLPGSVGIVDECAATSPPPICSRMLWSRHRPRPKVSAASSSRRRPWGDR